ncbi:predicted ATPase [Alteracholeplasma palmae J233]|uniref:Predicted ATPase n=1 Tax=Alteracholeplasma palmae (strain ATCC 49389 / J233) TaxID=1318466 RepID=U4KJP4_ALTPJ|nr:ATP-binding protein [Alteracholeplasma palmae]CCV63628.1 predicted ATPase [Alteracholeplasma palmae J233]
MIKRKTYIDELLKYKDKPFIKVITGMRRTGKSVLMEQFQEMLVSERKIATSQVIKINFELPDSFKIENYQDLTNYILEKTNKEYKRTYLFFDEIQRVKDWEKAVNGFHAMGIYDIYITGSNADLLSSELSTYLAGRYVEIKVKPMNFKEFIKAYQGITQNIEELFNKYIIFGGMPSIIAFNLDYSQSMNILRESFQSAFFRDVVIKNQIRNTIALDRLIYYVIQHTGKTFSALSISNYFKSEKISFSVDTVLAYLGYIKSAYLISEVKRIDAVGKKQLATSEKYYIEDHGIREAVSGNNNANIELVLETIIYNELILRGYKVYVGKVKEYEIDFVCIHEDHSKSYYQISYMMPTTETIEREFSPLELIDDSYPKYVLTLDKINFSRNGIKHINIIDFLTE